MKKILFLSLAIISLFVLASCNNNNSDVTAEFSNYDISSDYITFDVTVNDPSSEITGYTYAKLYDDSGDTVDSYALEFADDETSLEETEITFDDLDAGTDYQLVVVATIGKKNVEITSYDFTTYTEDNTLITTAEEFLAMGSNRSGDYILQNNIDFSGIEFTSPFPSGKSFTGTFDGQGYTLSNITFSDVQIYTGVFAYVSSGTISNLNLDNVNIGTEAAPLEREASTRVGFIAGYVSSEYAEITDVNVTNSSMYISSTSASSSSYFYVGGAIGEMRGFLTNVSVENVNLNLDSTGVTPTKIGGAVGYLYEDAHLSQVSSTGSIDYTLVGDELDDEVNSNVEVGGVAGRNGAVTYTDSVVDVYSTADININISYNTVEGTESAIYSLNVGGIFGFSQATFKEGFYSGSIAVTQVSTANEANTSKVFNIGGLVGNYFGRVGLASLIRFGNGASITVSTSDDVLLYVAQLVGDSNNKVTSTIGVYGSQSITVNTVAGAAEDEVTDVTSYFASEWLQDAFDAINVG